MKQEFGLSLSKPNSHFMTEELLKFLWEHKLYSPESLILPDGSKIEVIHPGEHNRDAGPDFFNTRIKIENTIWAGNAEIHVNASDWDKHGHSSNGAFDNVILHIVENNDAQIMDSFGNRVPTISLKCNESIIKQYEYLQQNKLWVPCAREVSKLDPFVISMWLEKLGIARLEEKSLDISKHLELTQNDWEETLYRVLARSFGFHLNGQPFEQLAKSLPFKILEKHLDSLLYSEALLFGQAGFLNELIPYDDYFLKLQKEYQFLAKKYKLRPNPKYIWKFLRLRPVNFPTIRIAQFASVLHHCSKLFSFIKEENSMECLKEVFEIQPSSYWENHYQFGKVSKPKEKPIGKDSADIILINAIIPVLFIYGKRTGLQEYQNKALEFLEKINPEKNSVIENWQKYGIKANSAFHSQALIQLKSNYCDKHLCLDCSIGNKILTNSKT